MRAAQIALLVAVLAGCRPAPVVHVSPTAGQTPAPPPARPTPAATARAAEAGSPSIPAPSEDGPNGPAAPTGYRRPGVPGQALTPETTPAGFTVRGSDGMVDADGGLWYLADAPDPTLVHLDATGAERGRWGRWSKEPGARQTAHLIVPGEGWYTTMTADGDPDVDDDRSTDVLVFTPVAGRPGWRWAGGGTVADVWLAPGLDLTWVRANTLMGGQEEHAVVAIGPDGREAGRQAVAIEGAAGVRPDGAIGVYDADTFRVIGPRAEPWLAVPRGGGDQPERRPRMDAQGRFWWWDRADRLQRLDPSGQDGVADPGPAPAVTPPPGERPLDGLALPGGDRWVDGGRVPGRFLFDAPAAVVRVSPSNAVLAVRELPAFHVARPIGLAGAKVWVEADYGEDTRYGRRVLRVGSLAAAARSPAVPGRRAPARGPVAARRGGRAGRGVPPPLSARLRRGLRGAGRRGRHARPVRRAARPRPGLAHGRGRPRPGDGHARGG